MSIDSSLNNEIGCKTVYEEAKLVFMLNSLGLLEFSSEGLMLKLKLQYFGHLMLRTDSLEKTLRLGNIEGQKEKGMTEDEMV